MPGPTPWWFPSSTGGGAMREDRIVLPIPPGKHWAEEMPVILVGETAKPELTDGRAAKVARVPKNAAASPNGAGRFGPRQFGGPSSALP